LRNGLLCPADPLELFLGYPSVQCVLFVSALYMVDSFFAPPPKTVQSIELTLHVKVKIFHKLDPKNHSLNTFMFIQIESIPEESKFILEESKPVLKRFGLSGGSGFLKS
jgi:hypothetical protein